MSSWGTEVAGGLLVSRLVSILRKRSVKGGLICIYIYIYIYIYITREQTDRKGTKGIIKNNFPIQKMYHTN